MKNKNTEDLRELFRLPELRRLVEAEILEEKGKCPAPTIVHRYLLGRSDPDEIKRVRHHMARCEGCLVAIYQLRVVRKKKRKGGKK